MKQFQGKKVVVTGGAAGIDTAAHLAALETGGATVAVVACGLDISYPAANRALFERIVAEGGAVLSEYPLGAGPEPWRFPARNRIIAGMTRLSGKSELVKSFFDRGRRQVDAARQW